jgi:LPS-assembly lipoprotein
MHRRLFFATASLAGLTLLAGCGFHLRAAQPMPFATVAVTPEGGGGVAADLTRYFGDAVRPVAPGKGAQAPDAILDILQEVREKSVVAVNSSGQVREFQLRMRVKFRLRTPQGRELIAPADIEQFRDISFNESAVLAKEAEEVLLYRDMQSDIVQQVLRRLSAAARSVPASGPATSTSTAPAPVP